MRVKQSIALELCAGISCDNAKHLSSQVSFPLSVQQLYLQSVLFHTLHIHVHPT